MYILNSLLHVKTLGDPFLLLTYDSDSPKWAFPNIHFFVSVLCSMFTVSSNPLHLIEAQLTAHGSRLPHATEVPMAALLDTHRTNFPITGKQRGYFQDKGLGGSG